MPAWARRFAIAVGALLAIYLIGLASEALLIEYVQRIVLLAGINVILAVGLNLINGTTGQFSIGHAGFMAVGAYAAAFSGTELAPIVGAALAFEGGLPGRRHARLR
jgi:branched-chain amino acid transport system permease protein